MRKPLIAAFSAALMGWGLTGTATADSHGDKVIVVDEPDLRALTMADQRTRVSDVIGREVYSNNGTHLGEIEDFVFARGGYLYAIVDYQDGPLDELIEFTEDGDAVVPWNELRMSTVDELRMSK